MQCSVAARAPGLAAGPGRRLLKDSTRQLFLSSCHRRQKQPRSGGSSSPPSPALLGRRCCLPPARLSAPRTRASPAWVCISPSSGVSPCTPPKGRFGSRRPHCQSRRSEPPSPRLSPATNLPRAQPGASQATPRGDSYPLVSFQPSKEHR